MRFLVFTMVYNEGDNLDRWVKYYGEQVGRENLAILDHSSNDGSIERLNGVAHIQIPRGALDEYQRADIISQFQQKLKPNFDAIVFVDCDEFLVAEPRKYGSLFHYLVEFQLGATICTRAVGLNVVHMPQHEARFDPREKILAQRSYAVFQSLYAKPVLAKEAMTWEVGCHKSSLPSVVDPDLYLFHLRDIDFERSMQKLSASRGWEWAASNIELGIGYHSRREDDDYAEEHFLCLQRELAEIGPQPFEFATEIEHVNALQPGDFRGRVCQIPKRFRSIF